MIHAYLGCLSNTTPRDETMPSQDSKNSTEPLMKIITIKNGNTTEENTENYIGKEEQNWISVSRVYQNGNESAAQTKLNKKQRENISLSNWAPKTSQCGA